MRLKFLGTSAGWPLPRLGCSCQICTSTDPRDRRTRTQILIDDSVLLDAGPDTYRPSGHKTGTHQFLEDYLRQNAGPNFHISHDGLELTI